ncbi:MAG: RNA 2',3'-cyclic phosphodiesterase [Proteobacteria bacterium]|nr:RNA 2',3'-cyclic phosphodiesterase [Pseudomonadota bacterium]
MQPHPVTDRRLFFALLPDEPQRRAFVAAVHGSAGRSGGRSVPWQNLHLTLAFLGRVPKARVPELMRLAHAVAANQAGGAVEFGFAELAYWPRPAVLHAPARPLAGAAAGFERLLRLAEALRSTTGAGGFSPDLKPFHPHVTVARKVPPAPDARTLAAPALADVAWRCGSFALMQIAHRGEGALYSTVGSWLLVDSK